jgi:hypothetical protein
VPTYDVPEQVLREFRKLPLEQQRRFMQALQQFVEALRHQPPAFPPRLRVKRVQGPPGRVGAELRPRRAGHLRGRRGAEAR